MIRVNYIILCVYLDKKITPRPRFSFPSPPLARNRCDPSTVLVRESERAPRTLRSPEQKTVSRTVNDNNREPSILFGQHFKGKRDNDCLLKFLYKTKTKKSAPLYVK